MAHRANLVVSALNALASSPTYNSDSDAILVVIGDYFDDPDDDWSSGMLMNTIIIL